MLVYLNALRAFTVSGTAGPLPRLKQWVAAARQQYADTEDRSFNYRGVQIFARYTPDRTISSFAVQHEGRFILSKSHVGIRRIVDTIQGRLPSLAATTDYQYITAVHPPADEADDGYLYLSDALTHFCDICSAPASRSGNDGERKA